MGNMKYFQAFIVATLVHSGNSQGTAEDKGCPPLPPGIPSFRPPPLTRFYAAWNTVQGTARQEYLSTLPTRGGGILDMSCLGFDVLGYDDSNPEMQQGVEFGLNKKFNVADVIYYNRTFDYLGDYHLKIHSLVDIQYGNYSKSSGSPYGNSYSHSTSYDSASYSYDSVYYSYPTSYDSVYFQSPEAFEKIDSYSKSFKILFWSGTEVIYYNCESVDVHLIIFTTYIPSKKSQIPLSTAEFLNEQGIDARSLTWLRVDQENCVYPNQARYPALIATLDEN